MTEARPAPSASACAICGKAVQAQYRPFCSRRCADVDLQRWLAGAYAVPGEGVTMEDEDPSSGRND
jgi:endogenous inhibitor of DNA gyrase (YacG/DUF329 family)